MSLISGRNLIAPFTNKVHLVTIMVISLLFGVYRLAGGSLSVESRSTFYEPRGGTFVESERAASGEMAKPEAAEPAETTRSAPGKPLSKFGANNPQDDVLDKLMGGKKTSPPDQRAPDDKLADIERSLGLRQ